MDRKVRSVNLGETEVVKGVHLRIGMRGIVSAGKGKGVRRIA